MNQQVEITPDRIAQADPIKVAIARLMSDGRWRSVEDIHNRLMIPDQVIIDALKKMAAAKLLEWEQPKGENNRIYRRADYDLTTLEGLTPRHAVLTMLGKHQPISGAGLSEKIDTMSRATVAKVLLQLEEQGAVRRTGTNIKSRWEVAP